MDVRQIFAATPDLFLLWPIGMMSVRSGAANVTHGAVGRTVLMCISLLSI
jgi:hypothetical protein